MAASCALYGFVPGATRNITLATKHHLFYLTVMTKSGPARLCYFGMRFTIVAVTGNLHILRNVCLLNMHIVWLACITFKIQNTWVKI